jgi:hypothetical protein
LGFRTFQSHFEESNDIFRGKKFASIASNPLTLFYTLRPFQWPEKLPQPEFVCGSYASHKLTYLIYHHGVSGCHISPHYSHMWG